MKVMKFSGADNHEAMMKVRNELGPDAVILHQRKVKPKGLFGVFKKPVIEVVAALETVPKPVANPTPKPVVKPTSKVTMMERPSEVLTENQSKKPLTMPSPEPTGKELTKDIYEIKHMLSTMMKRVNQESMPAIIKDLQIPALEGLYQRLKDQEVHEEILEKLFQQLGDYGKSLGANDQKETLLMNKFQQLIDAYMVPADPQTSSKVIFFVGPTGVGKTTTIAKLAAQFSLNEGKQVGLISADTYRIAAVEQLKTYSDILDIPIEVIYDGKEIHQALERLADRDVILVDTAGRSHRNQSQMVELKGLLNQIPNKEIYLVMSCTSSSKDIHEVTQAYTFLEDYQFIFTKLDEAATYGTLLNAMVKTKKPISYITTGQSVPEDIEWIDSKKMVSLLTGEAIG